MHVYLAMLCLGYAPNAGYEDLDGAYPYLRFLTPFGEWAPVEMIQQAKRYIHARLACHLDDECLPKDYNQARVIPCGMGRLGSDGLSERRAAAIPRLEELLMVASAEV